MKEMIFEWQWNEEEMKVMDKLDKIKKEYARKVKKFVENSPASKQMLIINEAGNVLFEIFWEVSQMDNKFRTKEKEIKDE